MLSEILHYTVLLNKLLRRNADYYEGTEINEEMELLQHARLDASYLERRTDDDK